MTSDPGTGNSLFVEEESYDEVRESSRHKDLTELVPNISEHAGLDHQLGYLSHIVRDMLETDCLIVLGKGLGYDKVLEMFLNTIKGCEGLVLLLGTPPANINTSPAIIELTATVASAPKREKYYSQGGFYSLSSQIFNVDVLSGVLDPAQITGIIILNAERVSDTSGEAFSVRLLKQKSPQAFIKAISADPERISQGFSGLTTKLKVLGVRTVGLWPRFHVLVDKYLPKLSVEEMIIEQDPMVKRMQGEIAECLQACLSDIKRRVPHLDVYFIEEGGDNAATLERLLSIPNLHMRIRSSLDSVWHKLSYSGKQSVKALATLQELLDYLLRYDAVTFYQSLMIARSDLTQPWITLAAADALLDDAKKRISPDSRRMIPKWEHLADLVETSKAKKFLVLCHTRKTMRELRDYMTLKDNYYQAYFTPASGEPNENKASEPDRPASANPSPPLEIKAEETDPVDPKPSNPQRGTRRRVRGGSAAAANGTKRSFLSLTDDGPEAETTLADSVQQINELELESAPLHHIEFALPDSDGAKLYITTYNGALNLQLLDEWAPDAIVMYEPDLEFTRSIEVWSAYGNKADIYFMYYHESVEEMRYLHIMRQEKDAFTKLIREKAIAPLVINDDHEDDIEDANELRIIGNKRSYSVVSGRPKVIVDSREFRSALPSLIWNNKMDVIPVTLIVGDYVLSPDMVVERKSLSDLVSSFRDGRLFGQCDNMFRYYKTVVLLIEFDNVQAFSLEPFREIRSRTSAATHREIQQNVVTLLLAYPDLRLVWSASPQHTAEIFRTLKSHEPEPQVEQCAEAGQQVLFDSVALDVLESMPGVDRRNSTLIAQKARTLKELVGMSFDELLPIIGREAAQRLTRFMDQTLSKH